MSNQVSESAEKKPLTIMQQLKSSNFKERIQQALGKKGNAEEFLSNVLMEIAKNSKLQDCTVDSVLQCIIDSANLNLTPNKQLGHAYLIPYENSYQENGQWKKRMECQLQIGYKGYIKKFGEFNMNVEVELVTKGEVETGMFEEIRGSESYIKHRPIRKGLRTEDNIELAYAIGKCEGRKDIIVVMSLEEIMESAKSKAYDKEERKMVNKLKGAWVNNERETDFGEMCKKTLIRRLSKLTDIDVVNYMSSYEGERDEKIKDITPKNNELLQQALLSNIASIPMDNLVQKNKMDEILSKATPAPKPLKPPKVNDEIHEQQELLADAKVANVAGALNDLHEQKVQEISTLIFNASNNKAVDDIVKNNQDSIIMMNNENKKMIETAAESRKLALKKV